MPADALMVRSCKPKSACVTTTFDWTPNMISIELKAAPEVLPTPIPGPDLPACKCEGMAMDQCIQNPHSSLREHALSMLDAIRDNQDRTRLHRIHYMRLAREYGCTNEDIGGALGVSEAAVRAMLKRAATDHSAQVD